MADFSRLLWILSSLCIRKRDPIMVINMVDFTRSCCLLVCAMCLTVLKKGQAASLTASPQEIVIGGNNPTTELFIVCTADAPGLSRVFEMEIGRRDHRGTNVPLVSIISSDTTVQVHHQHVDDLQTESRHGRLTPFGAVGGASGSLQFSLTQLYCYDASEYYCTTAYIAGSLGSDRDTLNITVKTYPEHIAMSITDKKLDYIEGDQIKLTCSGSLGNQINVSNHQNPWLWDWRSGESEDTPWTQYPHPNNVNYDSPSYGDCTFTAATTLVHTVIDRDNGTQFRCFVFSAEFSANTTIYLKHSRPSTAVGVTKSTRVYVGLVLSLVFICT
ncbi:uncharacterized protein LOC124132892 isoform X2 [Haliotis rufescens]|uniref:uncharacterized protein LOC124132892 isoform X2 n=1 Tax=Haliotis rufescens TaxID=6454 RepID=UPI00201EB2F1|nr:uncharacterized protein LOC124132892 isoform X2 [Haliotis rufescens]